MKLSLTPFAAFAPAVQPRSTAKGSAATAPLSKKDEMAARKLQQAKDAVATLATIKVKTSDDQKARAAQKVQELKARLQALKMIYAGDPKKLAKLAAQIARELAAAVRSYTSAGGDAGDVGGADASGSEAGGAAEAKAPAEGADAAATATTEAPASDAAEPEADADKPEKAAPGALPSTGTKGTAGTTREKADEDFKNEARDLARALKAALRRKDPKHRDDEDQRSGEQALGSIDQALGALPMADVGGASAASAGL